MNITPEAKRVSQLERERTDGGVGYYVQQLLDSATAELREERNALRLSFDRDVNNDSDSIVASCSCLTKTPEVAHHKRGCRYRLISERDSLRDENDRLNSENMEHIDKLQDTFSKLAAKEEEELKNVKAIAESHCSSNAGETFQPDRPLNELTIQMPQTHCPKCEKNWIGGKVCPYCDSRLLPGRCEDADRPPAEIPTPRTDHVQWTSMYFANAVVTADFARTLERELAVDKEENARHKAEKRELKDQIAAMQKHIDKLTDYAIEKAGL